MTAGSSEGEAGLIREGPASLGVHLPDSVSVADVCAFVCSSSISGSNSQTFLWRITLPASPFAPRLCSLDKTSHGLPTSKGGSYEPSLMKQHMSFHWPQSFMDWDVARARSLKIILGILLCLLKESFFFLLGLLIQQDIFLEFLQSGFYCKESICLRMKPIEKRAEIEIRVPATPFEHLDISMPAAITLGSLNCPSP